MISSSSSSILRGSLVMFISAYSDRESDSFSLMFSCLIWSWYFSSLLLRDLQLLLVLADCRQLILNLHNPLLSNLDPLLRALQLVLHHGQGPGKVVRLHLIVRCNPLCLLQVCLQSFNLHLVVHVLGLPVTGTLDDVVRLLGHEGELHHGGGQFLHGHGGLALHQDAAPRGCVHVVVLVLELLL